MKATANRPMSLSIHYFALLVIICMGCKDNKTKMPLPSTVISHSMLFWNEDSLSYDGFYKKYGITIRKKITSALYNDTLYWLTPLVIDGPDNAVAFYYNGYISLPKYKEPFSSYLQRSRKYFNWQYIEKKAFVNFSHFL
jgi:hypothetical protein